MLAVQASILGDGLPGRNTTANGTTWLESCQEIFAVEPFVSDNDNKPSRPKFDIEALIAAIGDDELPPLLLDDAPRGSEIW
jgi:hypothetical protein